MAKNETKRLKPAAIQADIASYEALQGITDYAPANEAYKMEKLTTSRNTVSSKQQKETQDNGTAAASRDGAVGAEWDFHNLMLGAKDQVIAQFGRDSDEAQAVGLKKKSEYKPRSKKKGGSDSK
jgi:hypothetical protein